MLGRNDLRNPCLFHTNSECEDPLRFVGIEECPERVVNVVAHQSGISNCRLSQSSVVVECNTNR